MLLAVPSSTKPPQYTCVPVITPCSPTIIDSVLCMTYYWLGVGKHGCITHETPHSTLLHDSISFQLQCGHLSWIELELHCINLSEFDL